MSFRYINARNLENKSYFFDYSSGHNSDVVPITKTWLTMKYDVARVECTPPGYKLLDLVRQTLRRGGGVALLFRIQFTTKGNPSTLHYSLESADWTLRTSNSRIRIIVIYRPPSSANHPALYLHSSVSSLHCLSQWLSAPNHSTSHWWF